MTMRIDFGRRRLAKVVASRATECASCSTTLICIVGHVLYCCRVSPVAFAKKLVVNRHVQTYRSVFALEGSPDDLSAPLTWN